MEAIREAPARPASAVTARDIAMLTATALGLAFVSGWTPGNREALLELAAHDPARLAAAGRAALTVEIGDVVTRRLAADLLASAAAAAVPLGATA